MSVGETDTAEIKRAAYEIAWREFSRQSGMTPDEKMSGPDRLRSYIGSVIEIGEHDPIRIAQLSLGMIREYEQILRSKARVTSPPIIGA